jgi:hypothetical protein
MYFLGFLVSLILKLLCYAAFCQWRKIQPAHISLQQYFWFCGTCKYNSEKAFNYLITTYFYISLSSWYEISGGSRE